MTASTCESITAAVIGWREKGIVAVERGRYALLDPSVGWRRSDAGKLAHDRYPEHKSVYWRVGAYLGEKGFFLKEGRA